MMPQKFLGDCSHPAPPRESSLHYIIVSNGQSTKEWQLQARDHQILVLRDLGKRYTNSLQGDPMIVAGR